MLCYSRWEDGGYCLQCVLFGATHPGKKLTNIFSRPYRDWRRSLKSFRSYQSVSCKMHQHCMSEYNEFLQEYNRKSFPINKQMHKNCQANVQKNRNALAPVVDTTKLCSRQNLPLRGHRDSVKEQPKVGVSGLNNSGNFVELLHYCCSAGDTDLKHHLECPAQNVRYTSPEIQNEFIDCCGEVIIEKIASVVKESRYYFILADGTTDSALIEQMSLIL